MPAGAQQSISAGTTWSVVIPTVGRPSLTRLLAALRDQRRQPAQLLVVDDRKQPATPLDTSAHPAARVLLSGGRGPAAARNLGWHAAAAAAASPCSAAASSWVVLLDDDVLPPPDWSERLLADLDCPADVAAVAARIVVPLPSGRPPTDWERNTAGLERAWWASADLAVRVRALRAVGGFDERFRRAYREDADLAARLVAAGWRLSQGRRRVEHPVRPAGRCPSLRAQRGNLDDALMRAVHGPTWRAVTRCGRGRFGWHAVSTAAGLAALVAAGRRRRVGAFAAACAWTTLTADFARRRIAPGPRTRQEVTGMLVTSVLIPPLAVGWRLAGSWRHRAARRWTGRVSAVLFDRDGTLIRDVPYNGDPAAVQPVPGAEEALQRLRAGGLRLGVVSNQSGIGRGLITRRQVDRVNHRVEALLGRFDTWQLCPHLPGQGCRCRKPRPGMVLAAARELGLPVHECVLIGDIGADVEAALAAGARAILVPTGQTRADEVRTAEQVVPSLAAAVDLIESWQQAGEPGLGGPGAGGPAAEGQGAGGPAAEGPGTGGPAADGSAAGSPAAEQTSLGIGPVAGRVAS